jgi:hypothetical protein
MTTIARMRPGAILAVIAFVLLSSTLIGYVHAQSNYAWIRVWHLLDGSNIPGEGPPYDVVYTDCEGSSTGCTDPGLSNFYYRITVQRSSYPDCMSTCNQVDVTDYAIPEQDEYGCDRDREIRASFVYDDYTYNYIRFKVEILEDGEDGDVVKQCCDPGGVVTDVSSSSPLYSGWFYRLDSNGIEDIPLYFGPACE